MGFGSGENKDDMWWRFLQRLEECIRGTITKHMDFINDIDLVTGVIWRIIDLLAEASDIINTGVAGGVNFNNIKCSAFGDILAHRAGVTGFSLAFIGGTVDCLG